MTAACTARPGQGDTGSRVTTGPDSHTWAPGNQEPPRKGIWSGVTSPPAFLPTPNLPGNLP